MVKSDDRKSQPFSRKSHFRFRRKLAFKAGLWVLSGASALRAILEFEFKRSLIAISQEQLGISNPGFKQCVRHVETNRLVVSRALLAAKGAHWRPPKERGKISTFGSPWVLTYRDGPHIYIGRLRRYPRLRGSNARIDISIRSIGRHILKAVRDIEVLFRNLSSSSNSKGGR
jgi:hypothetical protein